MQNDFNRAILDEVAHRPYPMPDGPWIMTQTWHDLLFAHWPVDRSALAGKIPDGIEVDLFDKQAWLGIVPFHITNLSPRGVPAMPFVSAFPELNVRTYVRVKDRPGVYFISLDAGSALAVGAARSMFHLPYHAAAMEVSVDQSGTVHYKSSRRGDGPAAEFVGTYSPHGAVFRAEAGTLDHFLTERYCLHTIDPSNRLCRVDIHHPAWSLQHAEADIPVNTMAEAAGLRLPSMAPVLHFASRQDMVNWPLTRLD